MLLTIFIVLLILWGIGLVAHIAGGLINLILLIALIVIVYDFVSKRRGRV